MCREIIITLAVILITANVSYCQGYTLTPSDSIVAGVAMDALKVATISEAYTGADTLHLAWHKVAAVIPAGRDATLCDYSNCYTYMPDSGNMNPVLPGDAGLLSLHITPHVAYGTAIIRYTVWDRRAPLLKDTLTWVITCMNSATEAVQCNYAQVYNYGRRLYISGNTFINASLSVYSLTGGLMLTKAIEYAAEEIDLSLLPCGFYTVTITGQNGMGRKKIFIADN